MLVMAVKYETEVIGGIRTVVPTSLWRVGGAYSPHGYKFHWSSQSLTELTGGFSAHTNTLRDLSETKQQMHQFCHVCISWAGFGVFGLEISQVLIAKNKKKGEMELYIL